MGEKTVGDIFLDAADLITIVIPPALPAAMTIGKQGFCFLFTLFLTSTICLQEVFMRKKD